MRLFSIPDPNEARLQERQQKSQEQMARGGLPLDAEWRLRQLNAPGRKALFTSSLSVNEFVLGAAHAMRPLGQVMGASIYHIGWQRQPIYTSAEMTALTYAQTHARTLALGRLQQEAALLGAHGVVGVRLTRRPAAWGERLLEFTAQGTAVALGNQAPPAKPFLSALSGQDYFALRQVGTVPVGFAFGTCVYYHVASYTTQWATQGGMWVGNTELTDYTQAVYTARHLAMHRLSEEAAREGAHGVVGVTIEHEIETYEVKVNDQERRDLIVQFTALGTAVVTLSGEHKPAVAPCLPLA